jgi:hypothetical protein
MESAHKHSLPIAYIAGTERLSAKQLQEAQEETLLTPRRRYGVLARLHFWSMDILYGRAGSLRKFKVLEIVARVPYQAWENVAYVAITHVHSTKALAGKIFERVRESRLQQDNEQWHLLILTELIEKKGLKRRWLLDSVLPQIIAFAYYHISWMLYVIRPSLSYRLNADFEDHAEHEYMNFVRQHQELESEPFESQFEEVYGSYASLADVFRQIGYDERVHKQESLNNLNQARFS